jgi:FkbH-like protein
MDGRNLRQEIDRWIAEGGVAAAAGLLARLWAEDESAATASFVVSRYEHLRPNLDLVSYRLAILRSFTVEPLLPLLQASAFSSGIDLAIHVSEFNTYVQEIIDPGSPLYTFAPDAVILAVQTRDVATDLWQDFSSLGAGQVHAAAARVTGEFRGWLAAFRARSSAQFIIHNLEQPDTPSQGVLDSQMQNSQRRAVEQINCQLRAIAAEYLGVYVLDYDALVARHGRARWRDERKWQTVRLPVSAQCLNHVVDEWLRFLHPLTGKVAKALVVDLDNTLWGGILGEDGIHGIRLGPDYPGAAYQELQRALLDLYQRGILLAICSKNDYDEAMQALRSHPGMLLKPAQFAAARINWADKAQNLREIAAELNLGSDSLAFLDDSPAERQQIRTLLPEVFVIEPGADPLDFARAVRDCPRFERLRITADDLKRSDHYRAQQERRQLEQSIGSREDFYRSLQQEAEVAPLSGSTLPRIVQLINKTNQFNLTTRRYTEQQLLELLSQPRWHCFSIRLRDRFADNGLVGVAVTHEQEDACEIDTLLLSCRVIGRTVETAFLSFLAQHARQQGARRLQGWFRPTGKNAPAREFYPNSGFQALRQNGEGTLWSLDLCEKPVSCPEWIRLHLVRGEQR